MSAVVDSPQRHAVNVDEFLRMAEAGVFGPKPRLELIEGEIIEMATIGSRHAGAVNGLTRILASLAGQRFLVAVQNPVVLGDRSMPQPDLALLKVRADHYSNSHPTACDVLLAIEVADSTLNYDVKTKVPLYAQHGIREAWVFDTEAREVRVYRDPAPDGYRTSFAVAGEGEVKPLALSDITVPLRAIFPG